MNVLIKPIISEKSMFGAASSKYSFRVRPNANKHQISLAITEMFKVDVIKVNIIKIKPLEKLVRGRIKATNKGWKKAIVTIKKGQKIDGFEIKE